jgi:hypothetical protein
VEALVFGDLEQLFGLDSGVIHLIDPEFLTAPKMACHLSLILARYGNFHRLPD